jgi:hypothetical protein
MHSSLLKSTGIPVNNTRGHIFSDNAVVLRMFIRDTTYATNSATNDRGNIQGRPALTVGVRFDSNSKLFSKGQYSLYFRIEYLIRIEYFVRTVIMYVYVDSTR